MSTSAPRPERVTHALVRDVRLPDGLGTLALVTLDNGLDHTKPTTLGPQGIAELTSVLRAQRGVQLGDALRAEGRRLRVVELVVERDEGERAEPAGQADVADQGVRDALLARRGRAHRASSSAVKWGFSQTTVPPCPSPTHIVVRP